MLGSSLYTIIVIRGALLGLRPALLYIEYINCKESIIFPFYFAYLGIFLIISSAPLHFLWYEKIKWNKYERFKTSKAIDGYGFYWLGLLVQTFLALVISGVLIRIQTDFDKLIVICFTCFFIYEKINDEVARYLEYKKMMLAAQLLTVLRVSHLVMYLILMLCGFGFNKSLTYTLYFVGVSVVLFIVHTRPALWSFKYSKEEIAKLYQRSFYLQSIAINVSMPRVVVVNLYPQYSTFFTIASQAFGSLMMIFESVYIMRYRVIILRKGLLYLNRIKGVLIKLQRLSIFLAIISVSIYFITLSADGSDLLRILSIFIIYGSILIMNLSVLPVLAYAQSNADLAAEGPRLLTFMFLGAGIAWSFCSKELFFMFASLFTLFLLVMFERVEK